MLVRNPDWTQADLTEVSRAAALGDPRAIAEMKRRVEGTDHADLSSEDITSDAILDRFLDLTRHVRTEAGVKRYHLPIGSPIGAHHISGSMASRLAQAAIEGGFTFDTSTQTFPTKGIAVALSGHSSIRKATNKAEAAKQIREFFDRPDRPTETIGGWFDTEHGEICLDFVTLIENRAEAIRLGKAENQQAIFDLETHELIDTGGTGDVRQE